jgi:hypothetical protein
MTEVDLDSIAPIDSPLRTIDELVESLDPREIEKGLRLGLRAGTESVLSEEAHESGAVRAM